jgi:hypothetical protein
MAERSVGGVPIPIFEQSGHRTTFAFRGWFAVTDVQIHAPRSEGVIEILQLKWGDKGRDVEKWAENLKLTCGVISLERVAERGDNPMTLQG